ncbi:MAG: hypothetical protein Q8N04_03025 [Nitrospira sp.]|nr:hypothetical protein [Nitrospira sp.]
MTSRAGAQDRRPGLHAQVGRTERKPASLGETFLTVTIRRATS